VLFADSYVPSTPASAWEPGKAYSDRRTMFIPVYPYVGEVKVVMGLDPISGALKAEDVGLHAYKVGQLELQPQTENIFLVYKEGWHSPEASAANPSLERTWTKKDALVSFKNPNELQGLQAGAGAHPGRRRAGRREDPDRELRDLPEADPREGRAAGR
jgi:hypothetical protein